MHCKSGPARKAVFKLRIEHVVEAMELFFYGLPHDAVEFSLELNEAFPEKPLEGKWSAARTNHSVVPMLEQCPHSKHLVVGAESSLGPMMEATIALFAQDSLVIDHGF